MEVYSKMKKALSFILVVTMLFVMASGSFSTFAVSWTAIDTAEEFATMTDGNYKLTNDIDLSEVTWTKIAEFSGVLDGDGYTVCVPADAPVFDKLTGTVKNVHLMGTCVLDTNDRSANAVANVTGGQGKPGVSAFVCVAEGAVVENVKSVVTVSYNGDACSFGGLVGYAGKNTTVTNCVVNGTINVNTTAAMSDIGGIVGLAYSHCSILNSEVMATINCTGAKVMAGALLGATGYSTPESSSVHTVVQNCLFSGSLTSASVDRTALVASAKGLKLINCFNQGYIKANSGSATHYFGYANTGSALGNNFQTNYFEGCASVATVYSGNNVSTEVATHKNKNGVVKDCIFLSGQRVGYSGTSSQCTVVNLVTLDTAKAVAEEFVKRNPNVFAYEHGKVVLINSCEHLWCAIVDGALGSDVCYYCGARRAFSGFVQFAETPTADVNLARVIMIVNDSVLTADEKGMLEYADFDMNVMAGGKTYTVNSEDLIAYTEVTAAGETYDTDGCQVFGFVVDFGKDRPASIVVTLTVGDKEIYYGAYEF